MGAHRRGFCAGAHRPGSTAIVRTVTHYEALFLALVSASVDLPAALAAEMVNVYISAQLAAPRKPTQTQAGMISGPLAHQAPLTHYEVINKRNIFNATPPSDT